MNGCVHTRDCNDQSGEWHETQACTCNCHRDGRPDGRGVRRRKQYQLHNPDRRSKLCVDRPERLQQRRRSRFGRDAPERQQQRVDGSSVRFVEQSGHSGERPGRWCRADRQHQQGLDHPVEQFQYRQPGHPDHECRRGVIVAQCQRADHHPERRQFQHGQPRTPDRERQWRRGQQGHHHADRNRQPCRPGKQCRPRP